MVVPTNRGTFGLDASNAEIDHVFMLIFTVHGFSPTDDVMAMTWRK
jgi:hypothetical protein